MKTKADDELYATAYALNEWEKDEWRRKIDQQPGESSSSNGYGNNDERYYYDYDYYYYYYYYYYY